MNIQKKEKQIPLKNYIILLLIILVSILILFYMYRWYETYKQTKSNISIMNDYLTVINYNELDDYIIENKNAIIYVSALGNEQTTKFESSFKNIVLDNGLNKSMLYLDITNEDQEALFSKLKIDKNLPYIIVYTDGKITATYSISKNNYNPKKVIKYLNRIGATDID